MNIRFFGLQLCSLLFTGLVSAQSIDTGNALAGINKLRAQGCQCGDIYMPPAPPIAWNEVLAEVATSHSSYMTAKEKISHEGVDGSKAGSRLDKAGYHWRTYGENVAMGPTKVEEVTELWKNSPSHCKNIMDPKFTQMGIGKQMNYWTQVFATPK